ncbi:MAG: phosphotransacetylase family protein [Chloroflexota bacterium]
MTSAIYITSTQPFSGKSALCVGLLRRFQGDGYRVGYMKPVSTMARTVGGRVIDEDAHFVKYTLGLTDELGQMAPILLNEEQVKSILTGDGAGLAEKLQAAFQTIAAGKELLVLEGGSSLREGWLVNLSPPQVADLLKARKLIIVPYTDNLQLVDDVLAARLRLGDSLLGGVINQVPPERLDYVRQKVKPFIEQQGVPLLACLPREKTLLTATVAEINEQLGGQILCGHRAVDALVENLMVGAMDTALALNYFHRVSNKAVITSGDRTDLQLSALETATRCLILTDNYRPQPMILERAEALQVPVILTRHDTMTTIEIVERFFYKGRFHRTEKVKYFDALLDSHFDFGLLYQALGLS